MIIDGDGDVVEELEREVVILVARDDCDVVTLVADVMRVLGDVVSDGVTDVDKRVDEALKEDVSDAEDRTELIASIIDSDVNTGATTAPPEGTVLWLTTTVGDTTINVDATDVGNVEAMVCIGEASEPADMSWPRSDAPVGVNVGAGNCVTLIVLVIVVVNPFDTSTTIPGPLDIVVTSAAETRTPAVSWSTEGVETEGASVAVTRTPAVLSVYTFVLPSTATMLYGSAVDVGQPQAEYSVTHTVITPSSKMSLLRMSYSGTAKGLASTVEHSAVIRNELKLRIV